MSPAPKHVGREQTTHQGAALEIEVSAALMNEGWDVYRSMCPSGNPDLVALYASQVLFVEVRHPTIKGGGLQVPRRTSRDYCNVYAITRIVKDIRLAWFVVQLDDSIEEVDIESLKTNQLLRVDLAA